MRWNWVDRRAPGSRKGKGVSGRDKESRYGNKKESQRENVEENEEEKNPEANETVSHPHNHNG